MTMITWKGGGDLAVVGLVLGPVRLVSTSFDGWGVDSLR